MITGFAGLAGVVLYYTVIKFGWLFGIVLMALVLYLFVLVFFKYARLEIIDTTDEP